MNTSLSKEYHKSLTETATPMNWAHCRAHSRRAHDDKPYFTIIPSTGIDSYPDILFSPGENPPLTNLTDGHFSFINLTRSVRVRLGRNHLRRVSLLSQSSFRCLNCSLFPDRGNGLTVKGAAANRGYIDPRYPFIWLKHGVHVKQMKNGKKIHLRVLSTLKWEFYLWNFAWLIRWAKTYFVRVTKGQKQSQQNHVHELLPHLVVV